MEKRNKEPKRVSPGGKGVAAITSVTWVRFALKRTIYVVWISGKKVKTPFFFYQKKKERRRGDAWKVFIDLSDYFDVINKL